MKHNTKRLLSMLLVLAMLVGLFPAIALTAGADDAAAYVLAQDIEAGKTYVLVADGQYALNNQSVDWGSYANSTTNTLGSTPVTVEDGVITSPVTEDMLWTLEPADDAFEGKIYDLPMFYLYDQAGQMLNRRSGSTATAPLQVGGSPSKVPYTTISFHPRPDGGYTVFFNTNQSNDYPFSFHGTEDGFNAPGVAQSSWEPDTYQSSVQLFEVGTPSVTEVIDFTTEADADKYEIVGQTQSAVEEGVGLALIVTRKSIEPAKRPNSEEYIGAEDVVEVPISDDWTATLNFDYDPNDGGGGYAFFSFFASQGDDYNNMLGIRGGDGAMQNFERHDGEVTHEDEEDVNSAPGFGDEGAEYWFRIEKVGANYTCYRSEDGEEFTEMFSYTDSGIEASKLIIDAYSASSSGNGRKYTLKTLTIEKAGSICSHEYKDEVVAPTCTEKGYTEHTCSKCGRSYKSDFVDALGHDFGEYVKTKDFTETERGELTCYCSRCDATKTRPIAAGNEKPHKNEILFISDVHSARKAEEGFHNLRALFGLLKSEDDFIPEVVSGGGDYIESSTNDTVDWVHCYEVLHEVIYEGAPDTFQALGSGNHEWEWSQQSEEMIEKLLGQPRVCNSYNSDDFAIFHIGAYMNGTGQEDYKDEDLEKLHTFLESQKGNGKVIFVQTHFPIHYAYNHAWRTTHNADKMIDLLNEYSDYNDICFVWGHNHRHDATRHKFFGRNDVLQISANEYKRIKFNYFNAGCLNENAAEQDAGPSGSNYGPGYCLEARLLGDRLTLDYAHITGAYPDPSQAKLDHNADLLYVEPIQEARESHHEVQLIRRGDCEHDYTSVHVDPTCTEWGKDIYTCTKCGVSYEDIVDGRDDPLGHDWDEGKIVVQPTREAPGLKVHHCTRCDATKDEKLRKIDSTLPDDIDFTTADSAEQYEILGPTAAAQTEEGLVIKTTRNAVEDCNGRNEGDQANTPEDMIKVPVTGDWTATLNFGFDTAGASNGYYQFFGFFAAQGDDYQNMAGVRGGDKALQNFVRKDGTITADDDEISSAPGLAEVTDYWIRIKKEGDTYTCYRSDDGEEFTEMFAYADTGIEADSILIDAYTGMTTGYTFTLRSLTFEETEDVQVPDFLFDDVKDESKFYYAPVYWAFNAEPQITKGVDDTHFGPDKGCTRGQVVAFLWRAAGCPEPKSTKTDFTDLKPGAFYEKAVAWAVENKITSGTSKTTFAPDSTCTRGQIVTFLWRYAGEEAPKNAKTDFTDVADSAFYAKAVAWAVEKEVTNGMTKTTFGPDATCTRGQVVTFLYRATAE